jgi:hypothetical protein
MPCHRVDLGNGAVAIVKTGKPRAPKCRFCRKASTTLCDEVIGKTLGGAEITCDAPCCPDHSQNLGGEQDRCPRHFIRGRG